ncbi:acyl-CoA binding protein [Aspergillus heteromorphus CBS 117.55]|uniref:Acyl-CoA binding protein n=1 Tax=Aspergillus heteromorphus CBS 117.55 TaxID=1448321 RepID=A0A317VI86_9EURO|nr:acyl-CoA binding protein [Aspergillus heteromorphus CBS 117.55]PWY73615.1 acyl-CoA binding protein [Aspergillus heteromorphus CBS 117.55]
MSVPAFTAALIASQSNEKYTAEVQTAAAKVDLSALSAAVEAVLAGDDDATVEGEQVVALKSGFEYATVLVKMLTAEPGSDEKLELYKYFKRAQNQTPAEPSFYQMEAKFKYNAWKGISHISEFRAQALYIQQVNTLVEKYGTRDA